MYIEAQLRTVKQPQKCTYVIFGQENHTILDPYRSLGRVKRYFIRYIRKHPQAKYAFGETCLMPDKVQPDHQMYIQKYGEIV